MISAKISNLLAVAGLCTATAVTVIPKIDSASLIPEFEAFRIEVLAEAPHRAIWNLVKSDLEALVPGVQCNLAINITTERLTLSSDIQTIEDSLRPLFPEIQCEGLIEWDLLDTVFDGNLVSRQVDLEVRQDKTNAHIDQHRRQTLAAVTAEEHKTITSCGRANRPGNCRLCVAGFTAAAVAEAGVCAAAAYAATALTGGVAAPIAWAGLASCSAAVLANLGASLTGCWSR
ncbi:hypothetical protein CKM354_000886200 [Cercospora kikuchii]|uniref:Uncharacterized protein n=1 Tax=Cercospora kikuchii TaxID=84275 RepID=A0A9P3FJZ8_9PEZI|nr:uncharacterized protein CKM354_000886200 [Cercospora kikuchii]GIZ45705.1 hypothetical protein CKM354_000886200 [Cercospora kikuchii]